MFERKLIALDFHSPNNFDYQDETTFRNFVSWLENQKIRFYTIEDRANLDKIVDNLNWSSALEKYLNDLELNLGVSAEREEIIEKLLAHAVRLEYSDNIEKINTLNATQDEFMRQNTSVNPLESIPYNSAEFIDGLHRMQRLLNVPSKENDVLMVLQAISKLISDKLNPTAIKNALEQRNKPVDPKESNSVQLMMDSINTGFDTSDKILNEAVKVLRLLHIKELRDLQTKINETIVNIQTVTANPKTDSSLGRVGK